MKYSIKVLAILAARNSHVYAGFTRPIMWIQTWVLTEI